MIGCTPAARARVLVAMLVAALGACYRPDLDGCVVTCGADGDCPRGLTCVDGHCGGGGACPAARDGAAGDGAARDGAARDGALRDGALRDARPLDDDAAAGPPDGSAPRPDGATAPDAPAPSGPVHVQTTAFAVTAGGSSLIAASAEAGDLFLLFVASETSDSTNWPRPGGSACPVWNLFGSSSYGGVSRATLWCRTLTAASGSITLDFVIATAPRHAIVLSQFRGVVFSPAIAGSTAAVADGSGRLRIDFGGAAAPPAGALLHAFVDVAADALSATSPAAVVGGTATGFTGGALGAHALQRRAIDLPDDLEIEATTAPGAAYTERRLILF